MLILNCVTIEIYYFEEEKNLMAGILRWTLAGRDLIQMRRVWYVKFYRVIRVAYQILRQLVDPVSHRHKRHLLRIVTILALKVWHLLIRFSNSFFFSWKRLFSFPFFCFWFVDDRHCCFSEIGVNVFVTLPSSYLHLVFFFLERLLVKNFNTIRADIWTFFFWKNWMFFFS